SPTFFGLRQWMPFLILTTWVTRQSETLAINVSACPADIERCSDRSLAVCVFACVHALFRSGSNPIVVHDLVVSIARKSSGLPLTTSTVMLSSLYAVSSAVRLTSPLP